MSNANPKALSRAAILAKRDELLAKREPVEVWGGIVYLRPMSGTERDAYEAEIVGNRTGKDRRLNLLNVRAKLIARCLVDDTGAALFDWRNPRDIDELGSLDAASLDHLFKTAQKLNGLTEDDVNDLAGNSEAAANGNSGSN